MVCVVSSWSCFVIVVSAKFYNLSVYNVVEQNEELEALLFVTIYQRFDCEVLSDKC
jgi:hypothetical protein